MVMWHQALPDGSDYFGFVSGSSQRLCGSATAHCAGGSEWKVGERLAKRNLSTAANEWRRGYGINTSTAPHPVFSDLVDVTTAVVTGIYETYVFQPYTTCSSHQNRPRSK